MIPPRGMVAASHLLYRDPHIVHVHVELETLDGLADTAAIEEAMLHFAAVLRDVGVDPEEVLLNSGPDVEEEGEW